MTDAPMTVDALATQMLAEIRADVKAGTVPAWVGSFADLHDFVDANEYGGLCEDDNAWDIREDSHVATINAAQDRVDAAIKAGALTVEGDIEARLEYICPLCGEAFLEVPTDVDTLPDGETIICAMCANRC